MTWFLHPPARLSYRCHTCIFAFAYINGAPTRRILCVQDMFYMNTTSQPFNAFIEVSTVSLRATTLAHWQEAFRVLDTGQGGRLLSSKQSSGDYHISCKARMLSKSHAFLATDAARRLYSLPYS